MALMESTNSSALLYAAPLGIILVTLLAVATSRRSCAAKRSHDAGPQPAWEWFCFSNIVAVATFTASVSYLLNFWISNSPSALTHTHKHTPAYAFSQPIFIASALGALGSLLYFFAFFGVAFVAADVTEATRVSDAPAREVDYDVIIAGAGTVGASLASVLARDGKRVLLVERTMAQYPRIIGELMQPGGIRALERMGLGETAKAEDVDPVMVEGYVCITPNTPSSQDLVLTYPSKDPSSASEYFGLLDKDTRHVKINTVHAGGSSTAPTPTSVDAAAGTNVCPVTGNDLQPRGRSFHNTRFVHQLRLAALQEKNVSFHVGSVQRLLYGRDLANVSHLRTSASAPRFAGFDADDKPIPTPRPADVSATTTAAPSKSSGAAADPDSIVGIAWKDEWGVERVATARLTIAADGMYSTTRKALHQTDFKVISHFAGVILHHPPNQTPLPYPNRGHVIMADPSPVLLYQISSTETRVLVDIQGELPSMEDGSLRNYFVNVTAPQLPECVRAAFIEAATTQTPIVMPNRFLPAVPPTKRGAILLGDSWNMRHPLTGGGMTVALRDVEALWNSLRGLDLRRCSDGALEHALTRFQTARSLHAATINILAVALYRVFSKPASDDGTRARLRAACIHYLSLGGACTAGPVGLLSGLTAKPEVLVAHFFAVALHAMRRALLPCPTPEKLRQGYDLIHVACMIIMPLLQSESVPVLSSAPVLSLVNMVFPWRNVDMLSL